MAKKKITYQEIRETVNEKGEVINEETYTQAMVNSEPSYIKLYLEDIAYLNNLNIKSDLLYELLKRMTYEHEIILNKAIKERVAKQINKTLSYVNNNITKLVHEKVLIRVATGIYQLNTYLFGKGSWKDIYKHRQELKLNLVYSSDNKRLIKFENYKTISKKESVIF